MSGQYLRRAYSTKETPQSEQIPGTTQVKNSAGGFSWAVDDWVRLDRFLVLGCEGGSYYATERELTRMGAQSVERAIREDGPRVVQRVVEISEAGRAPKNDPALFVLAMCAGLGNESTRRAALNALPKVARIGTHLFHFVDYVEGFRGWGRGLRRAIGDWYNEKSPDRLAFQVTKYQNRDGWSNSDLLRLAHPKPASDTHRSIYKWVVDKEIEGVLPDILVGFDKAQKVTKESELIPLIIEYGLTMEMLPTEYKSSPAVFEALLPNLGLTAVIRNLGNMSKSGYLTKGSWAASDSVCKIITDKNRLKKERVHPIGVLTALITYKAGHGFRGKGEWAPVPDVVDALDKAFYLAFDSVVPTGKRLVLALDVSGSMSSGSVAGVEGLSPRVAASAMAMVTYKVEGSVALAAFQDVIVPLDISRCSTLHGVVSKTDNLPFGRTDCAQPMLWAMKNKVEADAFVIYTDSETWYGDIHPTQALNRYRRTFNIPAKLIIVGMVGNEFSIANPNDSGMLDVVGFDTSAPEVMSQFIKE